MGRIFLSYAREDRASAERLTRVLERNGHTVWWDRDLDGGEEFAAEIEAALDQAEAVVVAWSVNSAKSRWVRDEAGIGGDTGRLVPVSIDGSRPPIGFRQFHTIDLRGWKGANADARTADLLRSVDRRLDGKAAPAPMAEQPARAKLTRIKPVTAIAAALLLLAVMATAGYLLVGRASRTTMQPGLTLSLLPFTTTAADAGLRDIAAQARDSLSRTLPDSGMTVRMVTAPSNDSRKAGDFVISGEMSRVAGKVQATIRMDSEDHGATVFTRRFEASGAEIGDLPERIGAQVAGTIGWAAPLIELETRHPSDPSVTADLMRQLDFLGDPLQGYQAAARAAKRDPDSAFAQVAVAFDTAFNFSQLPRQERAQAIATARAAAARAIKLAPEFGDTYSVSCYLQSEALLRDCENRLRVGRRVDPNSPFVDAFLSRMLRSVGRFDEARDLAQLTYTRDPYVPTKIGWMLRSLEFDGAHVSAEKLYQQGARWWPEFKNNYFENRLLALLERGDWQSIRRLEQNTPPEVRPSNYRDSAAFAAAVKGQSARAAKDACPAADDYWLNLRCMIALASLGDLDGAFALAAKLYPSRIGRDAGETERIWLDNPDPRAPLELITSPAAAPLRRDPRYLALAQRTGLLAYWRSGPLPDFCGKQPEPVCARLRS
jgi:hypothetical protein